MSFSLRSKAILALSVGAIMFDSTGSSFRCGAQEPDSMSESLKATLAKHGYHEIKEYPIDKSKFNETAPSSLVQLIGKPESTLVNKFGAGVPFSDGHGNNTYYYSTEKNRDQHHISFKITCLDKRIVSILIEEGWIVGRRRAPK